MKKLTATITTFAMVLSLTACGGAKQESGGESTAPAPAPATDTEETADTSEPAAAETAVDPGWETIQIQTVAYAGDALISVSYPEGVEPFMESDGEPYDYREELDKLDSSDGDYFESEKEDKQGYYDVFNETEINGYPGFECASEDDYFAEYLVDSPEITDIEDVEKEDIVVTLKYTPGGPLEDDEARVEDPIDADSLIELVHSDEEVQQIIHSIVYEGVTPEEE